MIAHWPKGLRVKPGTITDQPGHLIDFMATFIDIADAQYPKQIGERQIDPYDRASQIRAMLAHDVTDRFDGSLEKAAAAVQADLLVVVGDEDFSINPEAAVAFAKLADGQVLKLVSSLFSNVADSLIDPSR